MKATPGCPTCGGPRKQHPQNPVFPFCSPRCKLADLASWLNGDYAIGTEESAPDPYRALGRDGD